MKSQEGGITWEESDPRRRRHPRRRADDVLTVEMTPRIRRRNRRDIVAMTRIATKRRSERML